MNNLCAFLFVYCGLPAIKIKSAEGISLFAHAPSLSTASLSLTLSWLAVKPSEPFGPSHPPLAVVEINCRLEKAPSNSFDVQQKKKNNTSTGCHL